MLSRLGPFSFFTFFHFFYCSFQNCFKIGSVLRVVFYLCLPCAVSCFGFHCGSCLLDRSTKFAFSLGLSVFDLRMTLTRSPFVCFSLYLRYSAGFRHLHDSISLRCFASISASCCSALLCGDVASGLLVALFSFGCSPVCCSSTFVVMPILDSSFLVLLL